MEKALCLNIRIAAGHADMCVLGGRLEVNPSRSRGWSQYNSALDVTSYFFSLLMANACIGKEA